MLSLSLVIHQELETVKPRTEQERKREGGKNRERRGENANRLKVIRLICVERSGGWIEHTQRVRVQISRFALIDM